MLRDQVKDVRIRVPELLRQRTGGCRFCGQMITVEAPGEWEEEKIDELATECCECQEAENYAYKKKKEGAGCRSGLEAIWAIPENRDHQRGNHGTSGGNR